MRNAFILAAIVLSGLSRPAASQEWTTFVEPNLGTRLELPREIFTVHQGPAPRGTGQEYITSDGRAALAVYSQRNVRHERPRTYLRRNYRPGGVELDYVRVTRA